MPVRDVLIVGAGPSGLATAIAAKHFGLDYAVLEQGALVDAIARFPTNMVFFTTPELLEIGGIPLTTPYDKPTRAEALQYYRKVVDTFQLQVALYEEVVAIHPPADPPGDVRGRVAHLARRDPYARSPQRRAGHGVLRPAQPAATCPAKICRTCRTSTKKRIRTIASASSLSAARIQRPKRRWRSIAPAATSRWCIAGRALASR